MENHYCTIVPDYLLQQQLDQLQDEIEHHHQQGTGIVRNKRTFQQSDPYFHRRAVTIEKLKKHLEIGQTIQEQKEQQQQQQQQQEPAPPQSDGIPDRADQSVHDLHHNYDSRFVRQRGFHLDQKLPGDLIHPDKYDETATEVSKYTEEVYQFYKNVLGRNSLDGEGMKLVSTIRFGEKYPNAFWSHDLQQMTYGDGDPDIVMNLTKTLDVIAHEMTHGFISKQSKLDFRGEPGAIDESCADVFGSMVSQYHFKQSFSQASWVLGPNTRPNGEPIRSMKSEPAFKHDIQPTTYSDMQKMIKSDDHYIKNYIRMDAGGRHLFNKIPNHAFYLYCQSFGPGTYSWETGGKVWYQTILSKKVPRNSSFVTFAKITLEFAKEIHGDNSAKNLVAAWHKVGVEV